MKEYTIKEYIAHEASRDWLEPLYTSITVSKIRMHILDMMISITRKTSNIITLVYDGDTIVGGSMYYTKNSNTKLSTCSLYNLFSLSPGAGSVAFDAYWKYASKNANWFKFFVFKQAHNFYNKRNVKYWGASKTGETFFSFGKIYSDNVNQSMDIWHSSYNTLELTDYNYFEKTMRFINEKNSYGYKKLKSPYKQYLDDNRLEYIILDPSTLEIFL